VLAEYLPIVAFTMIAALIGIGIVVISQLLGPRRYSREKMIPYECGINPTGTPRHPFAVKYYLVALFFIIFDVEIVFFFPWAVIYRKFIVHGPMILIEMVVFIGFMLLALLYVWRKKALDWSE